MIFALTVVVFVVMLLLPVVGSWLMYRFSTVNVLFINATKTKDPRFFPKSFSKIVLDAFDSYDGGDSIALSHSPEKFYLDIDLAEKYPPEVCDRMFIALEKRFDSGPAREFSREVYASGTAIIQENCQVRALYAKRSAALGGGSTVGRWIDAEGVLTVYDDCNLGVSATSATHLIIGRNCTFRRLYAPVIDVGTYADEIQEPEPLHRVPFISRTVLWGKLSIDEDDRDEELDDETAGDAGVVPATVITPHGLRVLESIVVAGDIRSHKSVRLCDGAVVYGNIFAEDDVVIGEGCRVLGTIFSQEDVFIGEGSVLGVKGQQRSIVARGRVVFRGRARIYGFVSTEEGGAIVPDDETGDSPDNRPKRRVAALPPEMVSSIAVTPRLEELEGPAPVVYRKDERVVAAMLPAGATAVARSMFYCCENLTSVSLPATVERIDDFAFFGCTSLTRLDLRGCTALREIGASAFEGCTALSDVLLPAGLSSLGEAAFRNCTALGMVWFGKPSALESIGGHAFMNCEALASLTIPKTVRTVGMSAFYGCRSLTSLSLPNSAETIGPYFVAECAALARLSLPRALEPEEEVGLPAQVSITVRGAANTEEEASDGAGRTHADGGEA